MRRRNIVQLSPPAPIVADSAEDALDIVFEHLINEPVVERRGYATRWRVFSDLHRSYLRAGIRRDLLHERVHVASGPLQTPIDFAIANGRVYQLAHTWSFQIASLMDVAKEVKAWGYTMQALRNAGGEVVSADRRARRPPQDGVGRAVRPLPPPHPVDHELEFMINTFPRP